MIFHKFLILVLFGTGYFTRVRDGQRVHELYRNRHGVVIAGYIQAVKHGGFAVQCVNRPPAIAADERAARAYARACPDPGAAVWTASAPSTPAHTFTVDLGYLPVNGPFQGFSK